MYILIVKCVQIYESWCNLKGEIGCREIRSELLLSSSSKVAEIQDPFICTTFALTVWNWGYMRIATSTGRKVRLQWLV